METKVIVIDHNAMDEEVLREAGSIIKKGGLVAFPTETVYGLGGDALNKESSRKIYEAKGRPSDNPLIIHICNMKDLEPIVEEIPKDVFRLAEAFWPGPLTIIMKKSDLVPKETTGGLDTVAVRMPSHPVALKFIEYAGGYVAAPSANASGRPSCTSAQDVLEDLGLDSELKNASRKLKKDLQALTPVQQQIITLLQIEPLSLQEMLARIRISENELFTEIGTLEILGMIEREAGNRFHLPLTARQ